MTILYILHWVIAYRRCAKPGRIQFMKSREKYATSFEAALNRWWSACLNRNLENGSDESTRGPF